MRESHFHITPYDLLKKQGTGLMLNHPESMYGGLNSADIWKKENNL
jgi:hypothetical protein